MKFRIDWTSNTLAALLYSRRQRIEGGICKLRHPGSVGKGFFVNIFMWQTFCHMKYNYKESFHIEGGILPFFDDIVSKRHLERLSRNKYWISLALLNPPSDDITSEWFPKQHHWRKDFQFSWKVHSSIDIHRYEICFQQSKISLLCSPKLLCFSFWRDSGTEPIRNYYF